ncbi:MAG TPA: hypothetical protein VFC19_17585, partial [Candidatus Limnocylindrales bacterium]|nr:hypothetical protein [Candidatus Limnocylindrales bacterium]
KFAAAAAVAILFWAVSTALDLIVTPIYLNGQHVNVALTEWVPLRSTLLNLLAYAMWAVFGVGLGSLFRSQVAAILTASAIYLGGAGAVLVVFNLIHLVYQGTWVLAAPVIAPAIASLVMITPGRAFDHAPRSGPACWSWSGTRWCWVRWHATHVPPRHLTEVSSTGANIASGPALPRPDGRRCDPRLLTRPVYASGDLATRA